MSKSTVYHFNPTCELAVANGSFSYMPPLLLQKMESDLAMLPFFFAGKTDFVVAETPPTPAFLKFLEQIGFELPGFQPLRNLELFPENSFSGISPWGWSPAAHFKLKILKSKCRADFIESPSGKWTDKHRLLFERQTSLRFLKDILAKGRVSGLISLDDTGVILSNIEELENFGKNHSAFVLKAPLSSSGRGIQIIRKNRINNAVKQWASGVLNQQKYLTAEPLLDKILDFSFQFDIVSEQEIQFLGISVFETSSTGQYRSTLINPELNKLLAFGNTPEIMGTINRTAEIIGQMLSQSVYARLHRGYLGVDALVFRKNNQALIHPCLEINSRQNMGILTKQIEKIVHPKASGKFELFYGKEGEFAGFAKNKAEQNPLRTENGKLISGFVPLVEPTNEKKFGAYIDLLSDK